MGDRYDFDVAVIGAGPAGYVAGIRAAQLGARACVIEKGHLGGVCTNVGCIPTKVLWQTAELLLEARRADEFGVDVGKVTLDYGALAARRDEIIEKLRGGIQSLLGGNDVELLRGAAAFTDSHAVRVKGDELDEQITAEKIIIATGSRAIGIPPAPFDHELIIDSSDAVSADALPGSILIIGGGYIGVEFASIYAACGVEVTVVEMLDRLLAAMDADCAREVVKFLKKSGVNILTGTKLAETAAGDGSVKATLSDGQEVEAEKMLVCVGRRPDCEGLDIEKAGVEPGERGGVKVNERLQTSQEHIYGVGDAIGEPLLAHVASHEALVAAAHATGTITAKMDYRVVPACVFVHPEIATVGLLEEEAREKYGEVEVKKFPFRALGKAHISGQTDGLVKMIADAETGQLVGVHIAAADASSLLGEAALALKLECTAEELSETIHAHPTLAESLREAADGLIGMPVNWMG